MIFGRILVAAACIGLACSAAAADAAPPQKGLEAITPPRGAPASLLAGHFVLQAPDGTSVDTDALSGKPYALFFGFTHCPNVCPTTLADLTQAYKHLPAAAKGLKTYFVTVDPERDTPRAMAEYMESFDPRIVALSGPRAAVDEAIRSFGVVARRTDYPNGDYAYGHTASILLVDGDGLIVDRVGTEKGPDELGQRLAALDAPSAPVAVAPVP